MKNLKLGVLGLAVVVLAGCGQTGTGGNGNANMDEFINTFDGTTVGAADAFNKFSIDGDVRNNPVIKYNIQKATIAEYEEDKNCYKVEFFGDKKEDGATEYLYGNVCWNETNDEISSVSIISEGTRKVQ